MKNEILIGLMIVFLFYLFNKLESKEPNYDILTPRANNNVVIVDKKLYPYVMDIFKDIKSFSYDNTIDSTIFVYKNLYEIEKISISEEDEMISERAAVTHFWKGIDGKIRVRIVVNYNMIQKPNYIIYSVLLHEIGHAAFKFEHYEEELDLMNGVCGVTYDNYLDIVNSFYFNPHKYKKLNINL